MKKSQAIIEFIIALLLFIVVILYLVYSYADRVPEEIAAIQEQELCSEAMTAAMGILDFPGDASNWDSGGALTRLGLAGAELSNVSYPKWLAAASRDAYNISTAIGWNRSFNLEYNIYAFNLSDDALPAMPNLGPPETYLVRMLTGITGLQDVTIYSGSAASPAVLNLTLFFINSSALSSSACTSGALEAGESPSIIAKAGGAEVVLNWTITGGDLDCIILREASSTDKSKLVYITRAIMENSTIGAAYPIYIGNHTKINSEIGSSGYQVINEPYCEFTTKRPIGNQSELFPARFTVRVW